VATAIQQEVVRQDIACRTIASRARAHAEHRPDAVAFRHKQLGIWRDTTWREFWELVTDAAHGLLALGIQPGDRISIHSEDRPEWIILDVATVAIRGITVGLYPTNPTAEVAYALTDCGASVHFAEDQEQTDKVLEIKTHDLPRLQRILYVEARGLRAYEDERLLGWDAFLALGREHRAANPGLVEARMAEAQDDDVMTLVYTSGTTGPPKGAMLSNGNADFCIEQLVLAARRHPDGKPPGPSDLIVTYLPLCHVAERLFSTWHLVSAGVVLHFAEAIETVTEDLREVQPTLFFAVPRIWEKLHASTMIKGADATWIKRKLFRFGMKLNKQIADAKAANGGKHTAQSRLLYAIGWVLVFRALRERLGLRRCRWATSGGAPIAPEVLAFFMGLGIPVFELYGMTENMAIATCNFPGRVKLGTVGEPWHKDWVRLDEETGEVQTRHPGNFPGYWGQPDKTAETFTSDGWLRTGDVGEWVDGTHIKIIDRIKNIIITAGGKNISPSEIENELKASPYVKEAMVIGDRRSYLTALIAIEFDVVGAWALRQGLAYTTYRDLTEKPEIIELIRKEVDRTNEKFARVENIRKFRLLPKELDHEDGELTATQKIKRAALEKAFAPLVESMYGGTKQ
jgi:long-chain acyl-CoA synthetase